MTSSARVQERRRRIIEAAVSVFAERGYPASSTAQIAAAAGVSKETLYAYFESKAGLLREALTSLVGQPAGAPAISELPAEASHAEFERHLHEVAARLVADLTQPDYLALARIVVAETPRDPSLADVFRDAIAGRVLSSVATMLRSGQRHGLVDPGIDVTAAARAFVGPLLTYVLLDGLLRPAGDIRAPAEEAVRAQTGLFHRAVRATSAQSEQRGGTDG